MGRKHTKKAASEPTAEKAEALDQINGEEIQDAVDVPDGHDNQKVEASEPVVDPADILSADIAKHVSYWATQIQTINLPRRLFGSRRLYKNGIEIKGFKADLKMVYVFLLRLHEVATNYAAMNGHEGVPFALTIPVGVIRDAFGLTEATTQRYLATLGEGQEGKKTGTTFFGLVEWKQGCKGFHIVNIHDLRFKDVAGFELK
ncbi:hypothetical protein QSF17_005317 [Escherichia coli]|nr:hypothetical protein [Escherichia coli]